MDKLPFYKSVGRILFVLISIYYKIEKKEETGFKSMSFRESKQFLEYSGHYFLKTTNIIPFCT